MGLKGGSGGLYYLENYYILFETIFWGGGAVCTAPSGKGELGPLCGEQ